MTLPTPLPDFLRVRGSEDLIHKETVLAVYETLYDLHDPNNPNIVKPFTFAELVNCSKYPGHQVVNTAVLAYINDSIEGIDVCPDGSLLIPEVSRTIILAATEPAEVGFRLLPIRDVIEIP